MADEKTTDGTGTTAAAGTTTTEAAKTADTTTAATTTGQTPEQIAAAAATKTAADAEAAKTAAAVAPETYTLAIPEGAKGLIDDADLKAFEAQARAKGLTNDQAQAIVVAQAEALAAQSTAFRTETEADPIYGGDKLAETQRLGNRALDFMAPKGDPLGDALRADLIKSGFGNKLSVVAALARIGKSMAEDGHVAGSPGGGGAKRDPSEVLYDHVAPAVAK